ncbi:UbiA family prenyltransferase [Methylobacterium oryzisoli]|uniref:UbiA family prenyltransferase n=1 Tax=Methylobacterium oryzisoli TaxID=3385502 RepID=UPI0038916664
MLVQERLASDPGREGARPLVVDLDGTLIKTDILYESYFRALPGDLRHHWAVVKALRGGKAQLKAMLAAASAFEYATLPYDDAVLELAREARQQGREVVLATATDRQHAEGIAAHLGVFDRVIASDGTQNLASNAKAQALVALFGQQGFDYIGNGSDDLAVWAEAAEIYAIRTSSGVRRNIARLGKPTHYIDAPKATLRVWMKAIRVHQYAKNFLVFVPAITSHQFTLEALISACLAFMAFSACASGVYLLNDLLDLEADRIHPTKCHRPLASGAIPISQATAAIPLLFGLAALCAFAVSAGFAGVLTVYLVLTTAYSLHLKRKMLIDVVVLASLYTIRVIGGAVAVNVVVSEWLFAFSIFIFTSLALMKRYVELTAIADKGLMDPSNRNYKAKDAEIVAMLAAGAGMNAVTIFSLYVASPSVQTLYHRPSLLWLICPILLFWIARALMMAHRRHMHDDPVVFAIRDRVSRLAAVLVAAILLAAV